MTGNKHLHGVAATYTRNSDDTTTAITIVPGEQAERLVTEDDGQVNIFEQLATIEAADLSFTISTEDRITIDSVVWNILEIPERANGLTQVILVRRVSIETSAPGHRKRRFG